jgi:tetratricopeptide (TPR) repeat protein
MATGVGGAPRPTDQVPQIPQTIEQAKQGDAIARAIAELAHPDAGVRDQASRYLWLAGKGATAALTEAAQSGDPEVATRARSILLDFKFGIYPDTPKAMRDIIASYRDGQADDKVAALESLWRMGKPAYPVIVRLWLAEADERARAELYARIAQLGPEMASALVAEEEYDAAEKLLEAGVTAGAEASMRGLAAFRLLRGEIDRDIQRLRDAKLLDEHGAMLLVLLHRAKGDFAGARQFVPKLPAAAREQLLAETGDWATLANSRSALEPGGTSIEQVGLRAAYQRLAGEHRAADVTLKLLGDAVGPTARTSAVALLVNGKGAEAVAVLRKGGHELAAFQILAAQQRYRDALELAENEKPEAASDAMRLSASKAALLHHLGEKKRADEIFESLAQQSQRGGSVAGLAAGLEAAMRWDVEERIDFFTAKLLVRSQPNPDPAAVLSQVFPRDDDATYWWSFFREEKPAEKPEESLARVRAIVEKRMGIDEVTGLARQARASAANLPRHWRYKRLEMIGTTLLSYKADAEAESVLRELAEETGRVETYLQLGLAATRQRKWESAAEYYSQAMQRDRSLTVPRYLRGHALVQSGQEAAGKALIEQALLMPLADEAERFRLAEALRDAGLRDAEMRQYELVLATGPGRSKDTDSVVWRLIHDGQVRGQDLKRASRLADRAVIGLFNDLDLYEITGYLRISHLAQKLRARALLADGKVDEAMTVVDACLATLPASSNLIIEMTPELEKLGHRAKADALVSQAVTFHAKLVADHPNCASHHNSLAWTLARCRRQLDKALEHAKRAVELEPENCAVLDTLAEVHFQRNEKHEAIAAIRKCIELEPGVERHRMALERFEKLAPDTEPPDE